MELKSKSGPRLPQFIEVIQIFISQQIASWHLKEWNSEYGESAWQLLESSFHLVQVALFGTQVPLFIIPLSFNIKKKNYFLIWTIWKIRCDEVRMWLEKAYSHRRWHLLWRITMISLIIWLAEAQEPDFDSKGRIELLVTGRYNNKVLWE